MAEQEKIGWKAPLFVFSAVVLLWISTWYYLQDSPNRGTFGDMFGSVNALFSGLAFAGVIFAILLQKQELALQRKELELTRAELSGQRAEMESQNKTLLIQRFEHTFFQLIGLQQNIIGAIDLRDNRGNVTSGRDCFVVFYNRFQKTWQQSMKETGGAPPGFTKEDFINAVYGKFYKENQAEIGHYFRSLYHIFKLVDTSYVDNKHLYTNLVRAQLSSFELTLLFYNCVSELGREKFKPLVEKYAILKNMERSLLIDPDGHYPLYSSGAYG